MRRFLALILALAMTLSVVMPSVALAYDSADTSGSSSITEQSSEASSAEASASASSASEPAAPEPEPEPTPEPEPEQPAPQAEPEAEPDQSGDAEPESSGDSSLETDTPESAPEAAPVLRQYTLHSTLKTVDGVRYQVTVAYDDTAEIPKGTRLSIVELNQELSEEEKKRPENKKRPYKTEEFVSGKALEQEIFDLRQGLEVRDKDLVLFTKFLDLELKKDGRTIQPKSAVTVTVETDVVEEGVSDALEVALYNAQATRDWQKERKKLEEEQNKKLKSGKLKEEDAKRFPEKVYTAMLVTNETKKKKGVKLHFETEELSRMGVCAVGSELKTWKHKGEKVSVFGPRSLKADVKSASMQDPKDGLEKMAGFSVELKEKKKPDYDVTFWVGHRSQSGAVETQAAYEEDAGMAAYTLKDGKTKKELLSPGKGAPAAIEAGDKIGLVWDTGFRDRTLEAEQVTLSGLLPKRAQVETNDMLWRYSRPEALNESVQPGDAATLAAYDISIENRGAEYQPEADNPVTVRIQAAGINKHKHLQVWHLGKDDAVEVIEDFQVSGDTISFEADRFSVYLVVQITKEQILTASDGNAYKITVTYDSDAGIPADAELRVSELTEGEREDYVNRSAEVLGTDAGDFAFARAFDISLRDPNTGAECQPASGVKVSISLLDTDLSAADELNLLHFGEEVEAVDCTLNGDTVEFTAEGFSVYVITAAKKPYVDKADVANLSELENSRSGFYLSYGDTRKYIKSEFQNYQSKGNTYVETTDISQAGIWYFEAQGDDNTYYIYTYVDGVKNYMYNISDNNMSLNTAIGLATPFTLSTASTTASTYKYYFKKADEDKWLQHSGSGNGIRLYTDKTNATNSQFFITYAEVGNDYYGLDGKGYCIAYVTGTDTDIGLTNTAEAQSVQIDNNNRLTADTGTVARWTFENTDGTNYKISTKIDGATKYLALNDTVPYISETPVPFTLNSNNGSFSFKAGNHYLGINENEFISSDEETWLTLATLVDLAPDINWSEYSYAIKRNSPVTLDEIFTACGITGINIGSGDVVSMTPSDSEILSVEDMTVTCRKIFTKPQTLTLMLADGKYGTITVNYAGSDDLNEFLDGAESNYKYEESETKGHPLSEAAILNEGESLQLNLSFSEAPGGQAAERQMKLLEPMTYTLPVGLTVDETTLPTSVTISVLNREVTRTYDAAVTLGTDADTGAQTLTVTGAYGDDEDFVRTSSKAVFTIPVTVQVSTVPQEYELGDTDTSIKLKAVKPRNVKASLSAGSYNTATNTITYTAVVEAENDLDTENAVYPVVITYLDAASGLVFASGTYEYTRGPSGSSDSTVNGSSALTGALDGSTVTVAHMHEGDTITLTYTATVTKASFDRDAQMAQVKNSVTLDNNGNPSNNTGDDTATAVTSFAYSPLTREFDRLEGSRAYWKVTVNPKGYTLNGGADMTLADTFDDDYQTDADQSINYSSVKVVSTGAVSYDYSGNTGTFVIPDNTPVTITYNTRITAQPGDKKYFRGTAVLKTSGGHQIAASTAGIMETTPGYEDEGIVIYPSASDVAGSDSNYMVRFFVYAEGQMQGGVAGVQFILLDANQRPMEYKLGGNAGQPVTFTTGSDGYVNIELHEEIGDVAIEKNTRYYLEMIKAPTEYQKDNTIYGFMIKDNPNYSNYEYYNGDTLKVRLYQATAGLRVSIRFSGSYMLREDQKNQVAAVLQREKSGGAWEDVERHTFSEAKWGAITFTTPLLQVYSYRVIVDDEKPWDLPEQIHVETKYYCLVNNADSQPSASPIPFSPDSDNDNIDVVIDNCYEEPQLTLVKMDKKTGELLSGAVFSVYKIVNGNVDGDPVTTYTTDENGELVIRGGDEYESEMLYGIVETKQPTGYLLPQTGREEWHYFYFCNDAILEPSIKANLPEGKTAVNLTSSGDRITIDNQKKNITIPVMALWQGNTWPENTTVKVGLYQSFDGGVTKTAVTDELSGQPLTVELSSAAPYNELAFTGLPSRDSQGHNITYSIKEEEINNDSPLDAGYVQEYGVSDAGVYVVRNKRATSLTITKEWYNPDGTRNTNATDLARQSAVTFDVYRTIDFVQPAAGSDVITSTDMSAHVGNAEKVREVTIDHSRNWNAEKHDWEYTIKDLELMNDDRTPYLYYVLETVPSFGDEKYKIEYNVLESDGKGHDTLNIKTITIQNTIKTETAQLTVTKAALVNDPRPESRDRDFDFTLELKKSDNQPIRLWTVYRDEDDPTNNLVSDRFGKVTFKLKPEHSIHLTLPVGVNATVTEAAHSEYTVQTRTDGGTTTESSRTYSYNVTSGSAANLTYINTLRAVCKVLPGGGADPVVFESLSSALSYMRDPSNGFTAPWIIYMLEDYDIPAEDVFEVGAGESVILTTASTTDSPFPFKENQTEPGRAVITRGGAGGSILKNAGTLTLQNVILDGNKDNYSANTAGGLVYNTGVLNLNNETILRNSATNGKGGAVYSTGTVNMKAGAEITGNSAASASAICLADGTLNISGGVIENNVSAEDGAVVAETAGVRIYPTGSPIIYGNTNADGKAANIYLNANSDLIITVTVSQLGADAQIGVTAFPGHMEIGGQFGTAIFEENLSDEAKALLNCFVNDTNGYLGKIGEGSQTSIVWDGLTMQIKKVVDSVGANPNDSFDITLTSSVIRKGSYIISGNYDYSVVPGRTGVSGKIILRGVKADDNISISPLPAGTYIVAEASSNYKPTFTGVTPDTTTENGVQFSMAENCTVTVTNKRRLADVKLTKTLEDRLAGKNRVDFDFTVTLTEADGTAINGFTLAEGVATDNSGKADFIMSPKNGVGGAVEREFKVPVGAVMTITETMNPNYRITTSAETMPAEGTGTAIKDQNAADHIVAFTVTDDGAAVTFENERKMAHIDLTKELAGKVSSEESFTFSVTLLRADGSPAADYDMSENTDGSIKTDAEGKVSIPISFSKSQAASADVAQTVHTESVKLVIPEGTKLTVRETNANGHADYYNTTVSRNGESASAASNLTIDSVSDNDNSIVFRNERKLHTVTVTNNVSGYAGNVTPFTYIATVTDWTGDEGDKTEGYDDYDDHGFTNGVMTFELTSGQNRELRVPYGATLTVKETLVVHHDDTDTDEIIDVIGYETKITRGNTNLVEATEDTFQVDSDLTETFTNTQLINFVLVNNTSHDLENINVKINDATLMYRVNDDNNGHDKLEVGSERGSFTAGTHTVTLSVEAGKTAILEVNHRDPQGKKIIQEYEDPYTVTGSTPAAGYYYTINNEPSFHEYADPAVQRVYGVSSYQVKGKLRYSVQDSTVTFTEQPLVSFDANGGAWTTEMEGYHDRDGDRKVYQKAVDSGSKAQAPSPAPVYPTAEGIIFLGWTADETVANGNHAEDGVDFRGRFNFEADANKVTAPLTLYAVWKKNPGAGRVVTVKNAAGAELTVSVTLTNNNGDAIADTLATGIVTNSNGEASFTLSVGSSVNLAVPNEARLVLTTAPSAYGRSEQFANAAAVGFTIKSVTRDGTVTFTSGVCKITDEDGNVLYVKSTVNEPTVYTPAVFNSLSAAFTAYDGKLYNSTGTTEKTPAYVKMLVDEYAITSKHTFPKTAMTLTTAGSGDTSFPYTGTRDRAVLIRADENFTDTCFTMPTESNGNVTLTEIVLDGGSALGRKANPETILYTYNTTEKVNNDNTQMTNNVYGGGLIVISRGGMTIAAGTTLRNCEFTNYSVPKTGTTYSHNASGSVLVYGGTLTVNAGRFENLHARQGGAICVRNSGQLTVIGTDICFDGCEANGTDNDADGGAIYFSVSNKQLSINGGSDKDNPGVVFDSCVAKGSKGDGGAIYVASSSAKPMISGCGFTECSARDETNTNAAYGGGAICANNVNGLEISYCSFTACDTMSRGGAVVVYVKEGQTVSVTGSSFESCNCKGQGGGLAVYQPNQEGDRTDTRAKTKLSVNGCAFSNCSSGTNNGSGGAIQCYVPCMEFTDSEFTDCWAGKEGGAVNNYFGKGYTVMWDGSYMTLTGCTFTRCRAEDRFEINSVIHYGGAINTKVKTVNVSGSTFEDCVSTLRDGGALHLGGCGNGTTATITGSTFTRCTAKRHGGAVFSSAETLTISDNTKFSNCASTADLGGAVYHGMNCRTESNVKASTSITGCEFDSCSAAVNGGAVWSAAKAATITSCTITGCTAESGGAIYLSKQDIKNTIDGSRVETQLTLIDVTKPDNALARGTISGGSITKCQAVNGSAVYVGDSAVFSGVTVGGQETNTSKPGNICTNSDSGAIHGGTLYFEGNTVVENNKYSEDLSARDVLMQVNGVTTINTTANGLELSANIGVYVPDKDQNGDDGQFTGHGLENTPFGTWVKENDLLGSFFNDRDKNLFGYQSSTTDNKIYWGPYICKITDAEGNTLKRANGGDAVYTRLSYALDEFTSVTNESGAEAVYIKMLVPEYNIQQTEEISNFPADDITLTTETHTGKNAITGEYDGKHPYRGTAGSVCTIRRINNENPLFNLDVPGATFQLKDITLDGRKSKTATEGDYKLITANIGEIIVNSGTTLQYAKGDSGAAITGVTGVTVTINGSYDETKKAPTVKITNCTATTNGGAISAQNLTITKTGTDSGKYGTAFTNCTAATSGGAIYATGTAVTMAGASFTNCSSTGEGGALFHDNDNASAATTIITNCAFSRSGATGAGGAGGAVSSKAAKLTVSGSGFNTCTAATNGGAINHTGTASSTITGSTFSACSATGFGGSVYTGAAAVTLTGGSFQNSTAANHGGAVYLQNSANVTTISGTSFDNCTTTYSFGCGGAVYANGKTLTLQDYTPEGGTTKTGTVITNCKAPAFSGAVHMASAGSTLYVKGSTSISRCYANMGGAIYLKPDVTMNLSDSASFTKNGFSTSGQQVTEGACIYLSEGSLLNISGKLTFSENHPKSDRYVTNGGVYNLARQDIYIGGYQNANATSLHIAGELTGDTIWVWMEHKKHQQPVTGNNQFATTKPGVSAASLEKLRNAHDKDDTLCLNSDYLTGVRLPGTDPTGKLVYWNRVYEVSFKKKDNKNYPVVGAEFILYADAACTVEVARAKSADGENDKDAKGGVLEEGTVYFEAIPIGIYYMKEAKHQSYKPNTATYLMLVGTPTLVSPEYNTLWESGPLDVRAAKTTVSQNTNGINYGVYEIDADSSKALLDTNLALSTKAIVNERLDFPVAFMKLDGEGKPLAGASFTIYVAKNTVETTDGEGNPVVRPVLEHGFPSLKLWENNGEPEITATSADGTNSYRDMNNKPLKEGVVYYREIPIGTYYLRETQYPERNGSNRIAFYEESDRVFRMEVLGEEGIKLYEWDRSNTTEYTDQLTTKYGEYYSVSNINAVCKLTNGSKLLYELSLDGKALHPAVYASLEDGFNAAQTKSFYDVDGTRVPVLDDLKLQVLKDFTFSESVTYSNADRPLTFTTASRTASSTDRYVFNTNRTSDTSRALISRHYDESNVQDGALILLENVASLKLQNIRLDGNNRNGRAIHVKNTTGNGNKYLTIDTNVLIQNFRVESSKDPELKGGAILMDVGTGLKVNGGYNRTAIFSNNTVINNHSGIADGGAISINSKADVNNTIKNARFEGNTATASGESFGGAVSVDSNTKLTIDKVGFFSNQAANGGAVSVAESGKLTIETGELRQNTATANGGAVYLTGGATAVFNSGSFLENKATKNGGAVWVGGNGTLTMSGVTIGENTAAMGSAVYVEDADASNLTNVTVTNASITDNKATGTNGGAINVGGLRTRLYFGGSLTVFDNFGALGSTQQMNLVLSEDSNGIINTTVDGLDDGVIGVYFTETDNNGNAVFEKHGLPGKPFGTFGDTTRLNPRVFRSDHALALYGVRNENDPNNETIYWVDVICKLTDENDKILYQDISLSINGKTEYRKAQAVYGRITDYNGPNAVETGFNALINGFNAAQDKLYFRDETKTPYAFNTYENTTVKLKMLKDYDLDKSIRYKGSRMVTFTTAELPDNVTPAMKAAGDYFGFKTDRTDADGKALISRAFDTKSMIVDEGTRLTLTNITLDGAEYYTVTENGGIVRVESGASLAVTDGATLKNARTSGDGAGVYVTDGGKLYLSGNPVFGTTDTDANGKLKNSTGNFKLGDLTGKQNGGEKYTVAHQDIYLAEANENAPASLIINGDLSGEPGSIWVWAESGYHNKQLKPFAKLANGVEFADQPTATQYDAEHLKIFRNAQDDDTAENTTGAYLYGRPKDASDANESEAYIYWNGIKGSARVMLVKVGDNFEALSGVELSIYTDAARTKAATGTVLHSSGTETEQELKNLTSGYTGSSTPAAGGAFFIGTLPYGTYYVEETITDDASNDKDAYSKGYRTPNAQHFEFTIGDGGVVKIEGSGASETKTPVKIVTLTDNT